MAQHEHCDKIHKWFGVTHASYKVLPRLVLDDLPEHIQDKFLEVMEYIENNYDNSTWVSDYGVRAKDSHGKFCTDPLSNYRRGDISKYRTTPNKE